MASLAWIVLGQAQKKPEPGLDSASKSKPAEEGLYFRCPLGHPALTPPATHTCPPLSPTQGCWFLTPQAPDPLVWFPEPPGPGHCPRDPSVPPGTAAGGPGHRRRSPWAVLRRPWEAGGARGGLAPPAPGDCGGLRAAGRGPQSLPDRRPACGISGRLTGKATTLAGWGTAACRGSQSRSWALGEHNWCCPVSVLWEETLFLSRS